MYRVLASTLRFFNRIGILNDQPNLGRISTVADLSRFVATRAAFVSQKTLYGYVQTRMGMQYAKAFQDRVFAQSLNIAKMHVFVGCLSDLTIYAVAEALAGARFDDETRCAVARHCFRSGIEANDKFAPSLHWAADAIGEFDLRSSDTIWSAGALMPENFTRSPLALVRWAPIAPELKRHDTEIVENSIKFAWLGIREDFRRRLDRGAIESDVVG